MRVFDLDCECMSAGRPQHQVSGCVPRGGSGRVDRWPASTGLLLVTDAVLIADTQTNQKIITAVNEKKREVQNLINQLHLGVFENSTGKSNEIEFETRVNALLNEASSNAGKIGRKSLDENNRFVIMVNAGSKGSTINIDPTSIKANLLK